MLRPSSSFISWLGWFGVLCILSAYILLNFNVLIPSSFPYILLNLVGSLAILCEATAKRDYPPAVLNAVWAIVACIALINWVI